MKPVVWYRNGGWYYSRKRGCIDMLTISAPTVSMLQQFVVTHKLMVLL